MPRGRAVAARQAHNLEVAGSNPAPATKKSARISLGLFSWLYQLYYLVIVFIVAALA